MKLEDTEAEAALRQEIRPWLASRLNETWWDQYRSLEGAEWLALMKQWQFDQWRAGIAARSWPKQFGGQGAGISEDLIIFEELARADAPNDIFRVGTRIIAPMMMVLARDEQKRRFLPSIANGSELWSQGFSEPEAGSDVAALRTRVVRKGTKFILKGQKTWNSFGHLADYCLVLARSNPDLPKHKGLTAFAVPLNAPGIRVAPIRQMNNQHVFNEIFFDDVEVGEEDIIGKPDGGWEVAVTMLDFERRGISAVGFGCRRLFERLLDLARSTRIQGSGATAIDNPIIRSRLLELGVQARIGVLNNHRFAAMIPSGGVPGAEASLQKLHATELNKAMHAVALELAAMADLSAPQSQHRFAAWQCDYLTSFAGTIAGGTSQIQRNIIGERLLGLPR